MKIKIIVISIIVIILFMLVYGFTSYNTQMKLDIADEVCEEIRISIYDKENKVSEEIKGYEKVDDLLIELEKTNEREFNLTEYFNDIINPEEFKAEVSKEKPDATEEDIEKIYNSVLNYNPNFVEEEIIYTKEDGNKYIKVKDLRKGAYGEYIIRYFNGEYIINPKYVPILYDNFIKEGNNLVRSIDKKGKILTFYLRNENFGCIEIKYNYIKEEILELKYY